MRANTILTCAVCAASITSFVRADIIFQDNDPLTAPNTAANLIVNTIDATALTLDPTRTAVGDVILTGATKFVGFNPGVLPLAAQYSSQDFTFTMDYFVPVGTTLDNNGTPDLFYLQINFNGVNSGSGGFIGMGAAGSGWNTIMVTGTVPAATTTVQPLFVLADGGFGAGTPNGTGSGTALYADNFTLSIVPEPSTMALAFLGIAGLWAARRKR